jgi:hypothetical protein
VRRAPRSSIAVRFDCKALQLSQTRIQEMPLLCTEQLLVIFGVQNVLKLGIHRASDISSLGPESR